MATELELENLKMIVAAVAVGQTTDLSVRDRVQGGGIEVLKMHAKEYALKACY